MILGKYNQAKTITFDLVAPDGVDLIVAATFASGDIKIMKDEGVEANTTNLPTDEGTGYSLVLTATEMSAARIRVYIIDQTATKVWLDTSLGLESYGNASAEHAFDLDTAAATMRGTDNALLAASINLTGGAVNTVTTLTNKTGFSLSATGLDLIVSTATGFVEIAKAIWDRVLSAANHNIANSSGRLVRQINKATILQSGTAQGGTANTITLSASTPTVANNLIAHARIVITGGTGQYQTKTIDTYNGTTKVATLSTGDTWVVTPDATSEYEVKEGAALHVNSLTGAALTEITNELDSNSTQLGAIVADTNELQTNQGNWLTATGFSTHTAANVRTEMDVNSTKLASIEVDTQNIQLRIPTALVGGKMSSDAVAVGGSTDGATRLGKATQANVIGTVGASSTTISIVTSSLDPAAAAIDQFKGKIVTFDANTATANLRGQSTDITANTSAGVLTVTALTTAPVSGDIFVIT